MAGKIFINYRRGDDPRTMSALYTRLAEEFGRDNVLMDEEAYVEPGPGYAREIAALVSRGDVLLAIIGPSWLERLSARAGDPEDFVRMEIEAALLQRRPAIPVLVGGAALPSAGELPDAIRELVRRGSVSLRPDEFETDCNSLINALRQAFAVAGRAGAQAGNARQAAHSSQGGSGSAHAGNTRQAAHSSQAGQRAYQHSAAASAHDDDRHEAEELANWNFIKGSLDPDVFRNHLERFPGGPTEHYARSRYQTLQAGQAHKWPAQDSGRFGGDKPYSEAAAWTRVATTTSLRELEEFLADWPDGAYVERARQRIEELRREGASEGGTLGLVLMLGMVVFMIGLIALASIKF